MIVNKLLLTISVFIFAILPIQLQAQVNYHYDGKVTISPDQGYIKARWKISFITTPNKHIKFFLRDTLNVIEVNGSTILDTKIIASNDNNQSIEITLKEDIAVNTDFITITYDGVLLPEPMENKINSINKDYVELNVDSFWFPIDNTFNKQITANFSVDTGKDWQAITTGSVRYAHNKVYINNASPFLDISMTLAKSFSKTGDARFTIYDLRKTVANMDVLQSAIKQCYEFLNRRFGENVPLPKGKFILHERPSSGYARQTYIALSSIEKRSTEDLTGFVCHELSHFWASKGNFSTVENWLNESFAVYTELMAIRSIFGSNAYDDFISRFNKQILNKNLPSVWSVDDQSRRPYLVNYRKGPLLLAALEVRIGRPLFLKFIKAYMTNEIDTTPKLIQLIKEISGEKHSQWFMKELSIDNSTSD